MLGVLNVSRISGAGLRSPGPMQGQVWILAEQGQRTDTLRVRLESQEYAFVTAFALRAYSGGHVSGKGWLVLVVVWGGPLRAGRPARGETHPYDAHGQALRHMEIVVVTRRVDFAGDFALYRTGSQRMSAVIPGRQDSCMIDDVYGRATFERHWQRLDCARRASGAILEGVGDQYQFYLSTAERRARRLRTGGAGVQGTIRASWSSFPLG